MQRTARVQGHFGELMQGRLGREGPLVLVTLPCPAFTATVTATLAGSDEPAPVIEGAPSGLLPPQRSAALLEALGRPPPGGMVRTRR